MLMPPSSRSQPSAATSKNAAVQSTGTAPRTIAMVASCPPPLLRAATPRTIAPSPTIGPSAQKIPPTVNPTPMYSTSDATPSISAVRPCPPPTRVTARSLIAAPPVLVGVSAPVETTVRRPCVPLPGGCVPTVSRSASRIASRPVRSARSRLRSTHDRHGGAEGMEAVATTLTVPDAHRGPKVQLGRAVFALTSTAFLVAVALDVDAGTYKTLPYLGLNVVIALIALLLTTRRPQHRVSWVLAGTALWGMVGGVFYGYAVGALVSDPGSRPGGIVAAWFDNWWWLPDLALPLCALLLLMPDGRLASRRWWPVPAAVVVGTVFGSAAVSTSPTFDLGTAEPIENPLARVGGSTIVIVGIVGVILVVAGLVAALVAFIFRYRRSAGDERQQLRWVGASLGLAVPLVVVGALLWGVVPGAALLTGLGSLLLPAGIAVAVLKYRLYEIDFVVNRALVYGAMTIGVVASYVPIVGLVGATLSSRAGLL